MTRVLPFPEQPRNPVTERRLANLEKRSLTQAATTQDDDGTGQVMRVPWGVDGALTAGVSNEWPFFEGDDATLGIFYARIPSTTTTSTVIEARKNGVAVAGSTLTLVAGTGIEDSVMLAEPFADGDVYEIAVTTAGAGAEDLQTISRFE